MKIEWHGDPGYDQHLNINTTLMGWVQQYDDHYEAHCMWMREAGDERVKDGQMLATQYPEEHPFTTLDEAKAALLEYATVMYIGGWRGL